MRLTGSPPSGRLKPACPDGPGDCQGGPTFPARFALARHDVDHTHIPSRKGENGQPQASPRLLPWRLTRMAPEVVMCRTGMPHKWTRGTRGISEPSTLA